MKRGKIKLENLILLVLIIALGFLVFVVKNGESLKFDNTIYNLFMHNEVMTTIMKVITTLGDIIFLLPLTLVLLIVFKNKNDRIFITLNLIFISILNLTFKHIICRPRPQDIALVEIGGYSFPSGHSAVSLVFYGYLIYLIMTRVKNRKIRNISAVGLSMLIILIGISRIYLGVHFASDVLGGFIFGGIVLILLLKCYRNKPFPAKVSK